MAVSEAYYTTVYIGEKGCGKTTFALGDTALHIPSHVIEHCRKHGMKALFVDVWEARPGYEKIPVIPIDKIKLIKKGAYRVIITRENRMELATIIARYVRDTLIIFEDSRLTVPGQIKETPFEDLLISNKNWRCGLIFMYHSFAGPSPLMYQYIDEIEIFKTKSHPSQRKQEIMNYPEVVLAYDRVMKNPDQYNHETVKNGA